MTPNEEPSTGGPTDDSDEAGPTLLGEVLALGPRLASRTIAQIQASQQLISLLGCGGETQPHDGDDDTATATDAMAEPVDVLAVLGEEDHDQVDGGTTGGSEGSGTGTPDPVTTDGFAAFVTASGTPEVADLVIPGYDSLAASQVVPRLTTLSPDELSAIGSYELANRGRRTILNRVTQLLATSDADS